MTYKVTDGCHNFSSCEEIIEIADKKAPTPYCVNLASALMQDPDGAGPAVPMVELWACDFNVGSFDNCSAQEELMYTFNEVPFVVNQFITHRGVTRVVNSSVPHYFDQDGAFVDWDGDDIVLPAPTAATLARYNSGAIQRWVPETLCSGMVFNEASMGYPQVSIRMSVWDKRLNTDFCDVLLNLQLNDPNGTQRIVAGTIATESGQGVEAVDVEVDVLGFEKDIVTTEVDGKFAVEIGDVDAVVSAKRDGDDDNGISTLDLVLIQRHILGLAEFTSPYKTFAADVNNTGTVSGADVVELRQLVLGITSEFASSDSWRFLDASQVVSNDDVFDAREQIYSAAATTEAADLVAIKMGDVNGSAETVEIRSGRSMSLGFDNRLVGDGEVVEIVLKSSDYVDGYGYQFTVDFSGLKLLDINSAGLVSGTFDYSVVGNQVAVSYASATPETAEEVITLVVESTQAGEIADMLSVSSDVVSAEAYLGNTLEVSGVELKSYSGLDYALLQNEPNPFNALTVIGFVMGEAGEGTLKVYDVTGKLLKSITGVYPAGANSIVLKRTPAIKT